MSSRLELFMIAALILFATWAICRRRSWLSWTAGMALSGLAYGTSVLWLRVVGVPCEEFVVVPYVLDDIVIARHGMVTLFGQFGLLLGTKYFDRRASMRARGGMLQHFESDRMSAIGLILLLVAVALFIVSVFVLRASWLSGGDYGYYHEIRRGRGHLDLYHMLFPVVAVIGGVLLGRKGQRAAGSWFVGLSLLTEIIAFSILGVRHHVFFVILATMIGYLWERYKGRPPYRIMFVFGALAVLASVVMSGMRGAQARGTGFSLEFGIFVNNEFSNGGCAGIVLTDMVHSGQAELKWGGSYPEGVLRTVPSFIYQFMGGTRPLGTGESLAKYVSIERWAMGHAYGSSIYGEGYLNFGYTGAFLVGFVLAWIGSHQRTLLHVRRLSVNILALSLLPSFYWLGRGDASSVCFIVIASAGIPFAATEAVSFLYGRARSTSTGTEMSSGRSLSPSQERRRMS